MNTNAPNMTCFNCGNRGHYASTCLILNSNNVGASQGINLNQATTQQPVAAHAVLNSDGGSQGSSPVMYILPMSVVDQVNVACQDKGKVPEKCPVVLGAGVQKWTG